jgi:hypothetical protein
MKGIPLHKLCAHYIKGENKHGKEANNVFR